jgi:hypothetical protein
VPPSLPLELPPVFWPFALLVFAPGAIAGTLGKFKAFNSSNSSMLGKAWENCTRSRSNEFGGGDFDELAKRDEKAFLDEEDWPS